MRIYTRSGDDGTTTTYNGQSIPKDDVLIEITGCLDAVLASLDAAQLLAEHKKLKSFLDEVQELLWQTGGEISLGTPGKNAKKVVQQSHIDALEDYIDNKNPEVDFFVSFKTELGVALNESRVRVRTLERRLTPLLREDKLRRPVYEYINRLGDALYTAACNAETRIRRIGQSD